jgi:DNA-binding IclR family transcriptional regulator
MKQPLTTREEDVKQFILGFLSDNDRTPSLMEIAERFSFSKGRAAFLCNQLKEKGWITMEKNTQYRPISIVTELSTDASVQ